MMYYYWRHGRVRPSVFYNMAAGEKMVIRAFFEQEIEDRNKENKRTAQNFNFE